MPCETCLPTSRRYYYAGSVSEGATTEYRLVVSKGSAPASSMVYDGSSVALTLQSRTAATANGGTVTAPSGSWQDVEDNVSYTVLNLSGSDEDAAAIEGSAYYRPQAAGTYRFTASLGGVQVATAQLEVARADITIAPAWEGMEDETVPAELDDIQLTASGGFLRRTNLFWSGPLQSNAACMEAMGPSGMWAACTM